MYFLLTCDLSIASNANFSVFAKVVLLTYNLSIASIANYNIFANVFLPVNTKCKICWYPKLAKNTKMVYQSCLSQSEVIQKVTCQNIGWGNKRSSAELAHTRGRHGQSNLIGYSMRGYYFSANDGQSATSGLYYKNILRIVIEDRKWHLYYKCASP